MHRQIFKKLAQNPEYFQTHCKDRRNAFHFGIRNWYLYNNPQFCWKKSIFTRIKIRIIVILYLYKQVSIQM